MTTTPRTIPENPKPGERYAERLAAGWFVKRLDRIDGDDRFFTSIAGPLSEADARLLVFGANAVEALRVCLDVMKRHGVPHTHPLLRHEWHEAVASGIAALADLEVPK